MNGKQHTFTWPARLLLFVCRLEKRTTKMLLPFWATEQLTMCIHSVYRFSGQINVAFSDAGFPALFIFLSPFCLFLGRTTTESGGALNSYNTQDRKRGRPSDRATGESIGATTRANTWSTSSAGLTTYILLGQPFSYSNQEQYKRTCW